MSTALHKNPQAFSGLKARRALIKSEPAVISRMRYDIDKHHVSSTCSILGVIQKKTMNPETKAISFVGGPPSAPCEPEHRSQATTETPVAPLAFKSEDLLPHKTRPDVTGDVEDEGETVEHGRAPLNAPCERWACLTSDLHYPRQTTPSARSSCSACPPPEPSSPRPPVPSTTRPRSP